MQSDQKIGLSLLIALTGFGLALGFGRRESPAEVAVVAAELSPVEELLVADSAVADQSGEQGTAEPATVPLRREGQPRPFVVEEEEPNAFAKSAEEATAAERPSEPSAASIVSDTPGRTRPSLPPPVRRPSGDRRNENRGVSPTGPTVAVQPEPSEAGEPPRAFGRPSDFAAPLRPYVIRPNDTLTGIAARELGNGNRYAEIYRANEKSLANPDAIRVGQTIMLPTR